MMAWNDLDIDIENDGMDMRKVGVLDSHVHQTALVGFSVKGGPDLHPSLPELLPDIVGKPDEGRILETFHPSWYEAKEERTPEGKTVWFHGFEAMVDGQLWNVDLWFFDRETIAEAERYCSRIAGAASARQREQIPMSRSFHAIMSI